MKKGMTNVLILALVLINLVLTIIVVFTFVPSVKKTNNLVDKICSIVDLNIKGDSSKNGEVSVSDLTSVNVTFGEATETTISLKMGEDGKTHYARLSIVLNLNKTAEDYTSTKDAIEKSMSIVNTTIIDVVNKYSYSTVDKETMQKDLLQTLNSLFGTDCIYSVSFNQYLIQ